MEARDTHKVCSFTVRSYECGPDGCIRPEALCDYMQEAASLHAADLGIFSAKPVSQGTLWVMTRIHVVLERRPKWGETTEVLTFPRGMRRMLAYRDFILSSADGAPIAKASSEWATIDLGSRRAVPISKFVLTCANTVREPVMGERPFSGFVYPAGVPPENSETYRVKKSDIDLNGHVNNTRYIGWMFESVPLDPGSAYFPNEFEVMFRSETFFGETVVSDSVEVSPGEYIHRVTSAGGTEHIIGKSKWRTPQP